MLTALRKKYITATLSEEICFHYLARLCFVTESQRSKRNLISTTVDRFQQMIIYFTEEDAGQWESSNRVSINEILEMRINR